MEKIYLDYAATTPVDPMVKKAMLPYFDEKFGNPGSLHSFGQEAIKAIDESRDKIAKVIGANFREIIFTGSATEANNLALRGVISSAFETFRAKTTEPPYRIIISNIEHESIIETCRDLEREGVEIIYLSVDKQGIVNLEKLKESLNEWTILVSIMYANNEIGTIQPIAEITKIINEFKNEPSQIYPLFHTDAVQAFQFLDCGVKKLGVDLMTLSAHKIYGPKGVGALYARTLNHKPYALSPIITGGGQEFGLRSGTENVASIVGFAEAVKLAAKNREKETKKIGELNDYFWKKIKKVYQKAKLNGKAQNAKRKTQNNSQFAICNLPNILNIYFPGHRADDMLIKLDLNGIAVSSGSACSARAMKPSYVLKAIGLTDQEIKSSLRFSFGKPTTKKEINETIKKLREIFF